MERGHGRLGRALVAALIAGSVAVAAEPPSSGWKLRDGGIIRGPRTARRLALVFTGHEYAEGGDAILEALRRRGARASFFLTGDFLRQAAFAPLVRRIVAAGHSVGPHSDRHLLYVGWDASKPTLVSRDAFRRDVDDNLRELERFGVRRASVRYWVPAYEWYNAEIAAWSAEMGLTLVSYSPGTRANADYTGEADAAFVSSSRIVDSVTAAERTDPHGLNGFILLMHVGAGPGRADKMHDRLDGLLDELAARGYAFVRLDELLAEGGTP